MVENKLSLSHMSLPERHKCCIKEKRQGVLGRGGEGNVVVSSRAECMQCVLVRLKVSFITLATGRSRCLSAGSDGRTAGY